MVKNERLYNLVQHNKISVNRLVKYAAVLYSLCKIIKMIVFSNNL